MNLQICLVLTVFSLGACSALAQDVFLPDLNVAASAQEEILRLLNTEDDDSKFLKSFDVDEDGNGDIQLLRKQGRGPLSTYYSNYRLRAFNGIQFIKLGSPIEIGTQVKLADLLALTTDEVFLCSVGGSLRFPEESFEKFSHGTWWGREEKIGMVRVRGDVVQVGFAKLSVTKLGEVKMEAADWQVVEMPVIEIE